MSDGYASSEKTVSLNVIGKPIVSISPRTSTVTLGDTVNITCTTDQSYSDYAYIEWYKNGDILLEKNGKTFTQTLLSTGNFCLFHQYDL